LRREPERAKDVGAAGEIGFFAQANSVDNQGDSEERETKIAQRDLPVEAGQDWRSGR